MAALLAVLSVEAVCAFTGCNGNNSTDNAKSGNVVVNVQSVVFTADGVHGCYGFNAVLTADAGNEKSSLI